MILGRRGLTSGSMLAAIFVILGGFPARGADGPISPRTAVRGLGDPPRLSPAERLVREALASELAGDNARRDDLLSQALKSDSNCQPARWQSGYVSLEGNWTSADDAQQRFSTDRNLVEYRRRRAAAEAAGALSRQTVIATRGNLTGDRVDGGRSVYQSAAVESERPAALSPAAIQAHADLARWCRSKRLMDEERAHWTQVLLELHDNKEAESRLGLHWFRRGLYTNAQIDALKKQKSLEEQQLADWKSAVMAWRDALDNGAAADRAAATAEMHELRDPSAIPAVEWACITDAAKPPANRDAASLFQKEAIALLGRMPEYRATFSLTGFSVLANQAEARRAAATELKTRPLDDFVPLLLAGLANPIEFEFTFAFDPSLGIASYRSAARQEGRDAVAEIDFTDSATGLVPKIVGGHNTSVGHYESIDVAHVKPTKTSDWRIESGSVAVQMGARTAGAFRAIAYAHSSERAAAAIGSVNERIELANGRVESVLEQVTGKSSQVAPEPAEDADVIPESVARKQAPSTADYWWDWWADHTETYSPPKQLSVTRYSRGSYTAGDSYYRTYSSTNTVSRYNSTAPPPPKVSYRRSCFAAGTPVATQLGQVPIESLRIGDRVLAQDADSGELSFKPVLGTTVRPPVEMVLVTTTRGELRTTRGHPFWIVGKGWRMAKELQVGDHVVSLGGTAEVTALAKQPPQPAYNLIVADFGTYFVGNGRILVHDNTPRLPTPAAIPGYLADSR
jgi:hypothetical protein